MDNKLHRGNKIVSITLPKRNLNTTKLLSVFPYFSAWCMASQDVHRKTRFVKVLFNTLRPRQDGCYFADDVLKCIFLNENVWISLKIPLKFVPMGPINNIPALVQIMAWRRSGDKPLSEPMMVSLPTHICVTLPQWVKAWVQLQHGQL